MPTVMDIFVFEIIFHGNVISDERYSTKKKVYDIGGLVSALTKNRYWFLKCSNWPFNFCEFLKFYFCLKKLLFILTTGAPNRILVRYPVMSTIRSCNLMAGLWIRIRIGSGFRRLCGSGSGSVLGIRIRIQGQEN
jgi:hypothetical protein